MRARRPGNRAATEDEVALWRRAVADAAPLQGRARVTLAPARKKPARSEPPPASHPEAPIPEIAPRPAAATTQPPRGDHSRQIDRATYARLKKGRMPIEGRLDLHGMTAAAAERALSAFLRRSQAEGRRAVLVITGRGLDPEGTGRGVLKRAAPDWLARHSDLVAGYSEADRRHGGAGAYYVRLRRKDRVGES